MFRDFHGCTAQEAWLVFTGIRAPFLQCHNFLLSPHGRFAPPPLTSTLPPVQGYCAAAYRFKPSSKDGNTCFVPSSLSGFDEPLIRFDDLSVSLSVRIC